MTNSNVPQLSKLKRLVLLAYAWKCMCF